MIVQILKRFAFFTLPVFILNRVDIESIASLSEIKFLQLGEISIDAISALAKCSGLNHLLIGGDYIRLDLFLPNIGKKLISLSFAGLFTLDGDTSRCIIEHCPNLESLNLVVADFSDDSIEELIKGLKVLSKFKVNSYTVRLGTYWEGVI
jgi:hypothetical protein